MINSKTLTLSTSFSFNKTYLIDICSIGLVIVLFFSAFLGSKPLTIPDEARYSEIPREMIISGDYLTPHLNGLKYFEKPPLFYWLETLPIKYLGYSEWSLRTLPALLGLFGCLFLYSLTRQLYNRRTAILASLILPTSALYYLMAHAITLDIALAVFLSASLLCFIRGATEPRRKPRRHWLIAMYGFAGLAVLTKGLIAILFPAMIIGVWVMFCHRWKDVSSYFSLLGIGLFSLITLPWHILVQMKNPEFAHFYFVEQHFLRYLTDYAGRGRPFWFMTATILLGFLPWSIYLFFATLAHKGKLNLSCWLKLLWRQRHSHATTWFLVIWVFCIWLFFSASHSQLISYALPVFPALAILTSHYLSNAPSNNILLGIILLLGLALISFVGVYVATLFIPGINSSYLFVGMAALVLGLTCAIIFSKQKIYILMLSTALCFSFLNAGYTDQRSVLPLALEIKAHLQGNEPVVAYGNYFQDLPFYLQRIVQVVDYQGELAFGVQHQPQQDWMIKREDFWKKWQGDSRIFMIMSQSDYALVHYYHPSGDIALYPMKKTTQQILVTNHPL